MIPPSGASQSGAQRRTATILRESYFLDRFLVALASVLAAISIAFGAFHGIGLRNGIVPTWVEAIWSHGSISLERIRNRYMREAYPFDPLAPIYEQFVQFTTNVLTWPPVTVALVTCGILAVAARRYRY